MHPSAFSRFRVTCSFFFFLVFAKNVNIIENERSVYKVVNLYETKPWQKRNKNRDLIVFGDRKEF